MSCVKVYISLAVPNLPTTPIAKAKTFYNIGVQGRPQVVRGQRGCLRVRGPEVQVQPGSVTRPASIPVPLFSPRLCSKFEVSWW